MPNLTVDAPSTAPTVEVYTNDDSSEIGIRLDWRAAAALHGMLEQLTPERMTNEWVAGDERQAALDVRQRLLDALWKL